MASITFTLKDGVYKAAFKPTSTGLLIVNRADDMLFRVSVNSTNTDPAVVDYSNDVDQVIEINLTGVTFTLESESEVTKAEYTGNCTIVTV